ncbi:hypothetical protein GCM10027341_49850 [Spirosoma knui]
MKKYFAAYVLVWFGLIGCNKSSEDAAPILNAAQLLGSWQITGITADPAVQSPTYGATTDVLNLYKQIIGKDCVEPTRYEFTSDHVVRLTSSSACQTTVSTIFGFTTANWRVDRQQLYVEGLYDTLLYTVTNQQSGQMTWYRTEYNSSIDSNTYVYTITLTKK